MLQDYTKEFFIRDRPSVSLLVIFCFLLFFLNLGGRDLWAPDEPEYAQISQEMLESGDWIIPRMNGMATPQKPPLFNWAICVFSLPVGHVTELTARIPSALAGLLTVLVTYFLAKNLYSREVGLLSGLVLATSPIFFHQARWVQVDMLFMALTTLTITSLYLGHSKPQGGRYYILAYVFMALGTLTKGPLAVVLPVMVIAVFLALRREFWKLFKMNPYLGIPLYAAIASPWYIAACSRGGPEFANELIFKHNLGMFFDTWSHKQPIYYYLWNLPWEFMPWIVFLPGAILYIRSKIDVEREKGLFLLVWLATMFVFFSVSQAKQGKYLLPLFPALSIIVGRFWDRVVSQEQSINYKKWVLIPTGVLALALVSGGVLGPYILKAKHSEFFSVSIPAGGLLVLGSLVSMHFAFYERRERAFAVLVLTSALLVLYLTTAVEPRLNTYKSARFFCQETLKTMKSNEELGIHGIGPHQIGPYVFYTKKRLKTFKDEEDLKGFLNSTGRVFCIMRDYSLESIKKGYSGPLFTLLSAQVGHRGIYLVSNQR